MKERIKTLVLYANGATWKAVTVDTILRGFLMLGDDFTLSPTLNQIPLLRKIIGQRWEPTSYVIDWRKALCSAPELEVELCNITNLLGYRQSRKAISRYPLVIILHCATSSSMPLLLKTAHWFQQRRGKLLLFVGNEYDIMPEKFRFIRSVEADYVCSQLPIETAHWLYSECHPAKILAMPHALNPEVYYPDPGAQRPIDIGFIGDHYPYFVGDTERDTLISFFQQRGSDFGLRCKIRTDRIPAIAWARFLNDCKGTVGGESGTYFLDQKGQIITQAKAYLQKHPEVTFKEIFELFFRSPPIEYISGKAISSRHFEAIGTKTCQLLLEGHYNGILKPDEHYIKVNKDRSNIKDATRRFKDDEFRTGIVERAYEYVMDKHTYRHRVESLLKSVTKSGF